MLNLWSDISSLTKKEFASAIDGFLGGPPTKTAKKATKEKKAKKPSKAKADAPSARIAALAGAKKLSVTETQLRLAEMLVDRGYSSSDIPTPVGKKFEDWLDELMKNVPSAEVMDAAMRLVPRQ